MDPDKWDKLKESLYQGYQQARRDRIRRRLVGRITDLTSGLDDREISQLADKLLDDYMEFLDEQD